MQILSKLFIGKTRRQILDRHNWYRNMTGGYTHPHAMDYMTAREIKACAPDELEYKCRHGSMAKYPGK